MKKRSRLPIRLLMIGVLGMVVASCGVDSTQSGPDQNRDVPMTAKPATKCASFLEGYPCTEYSSTAGTDNGQPISWLADGAMTAWLDRVGGTTYLTARLPCGPVSTPVTITGADMIVTGDMAIGASGCVDAAKGQQQTWALEFIRRGVHMKIVDDALTWTNGLDSVSFEPTR